MTAATLQTFAPIGLDELMERAALLARLDRKYILPLSDLPGFLAGLAGQAQVLDIDGDREFNYRSVYFDTPELDSYLAAAHRRRRRFKLRVRSYLDSGLHFLEVKTRGQRGITVKERIPYCGDGLEVGSTSRTHVDEVLTEARIESAHLRFEPTLTTQYRRTTLFLPDSGSRVTIDTGLNWTLPGTSAGNTIDQAIVETKSAGSASYVDRLLWAHQYRPRAISKYATGLAALRPELPANRWNTVLRNQFDTMTEVGAR